MRVRLVMGIIYSVERTFLLESVFKLKKNRNCITYFPTYVSLCLNLTITISASSMFSTSDQYHIQETNCFLKLM